MKYRKFWIVVWVAMIVAVFAGSMAPARDVPVDMTHGADKVVHFIGYFVLSAFAAMIFRKPRTLRLVMLFLVLLGGVIEIAQGFLTATRSADLMDFIVNTLGVIAGYFVRRSPAANFLQNLEQRFLTREH